MKEARFGERMAMGPFLALMGRAEGRPIPLSGRAKSSMS